VFYNTTRKLVLKGVDGLVFVADSQRPMREANIESFESLVDNLTELGLDVNELPLVLQYNKRDLKNTLSIEELNDDLNPDRAYAYYESEAINGVGVFETLKEITKLTLKKLRKRMVAPHAAAAAPKAPGAPAAPGIAAPRRPASVSAEALARAAEEGVGPTADAPQAPSGPPPAEGAEAPVGAEAPEAFDEVGADGPAETPFDTPEPDDAPMPDFDEPFATDGDEPAGASESAVAEDSGETEPPPPGPVVGEDTEVAVEFDQTNGEAIEVSPPPMKRVQVSNQMDILAELEGLRKQATMGTGDRWGRGSEQEVDIESLLAGSDPVRELRERVKESLNSDIFGNMRGLHVAVRVKNSTGETIHTIEPVTVEIGNAGKLERLSLQLTLDLENTQ
jgi:hypothetical protein